MRNTTIIRGAAILLALLVTIDAAQAWTNTFRGTRDQVRAACKGGGMDLVEGADHTVCINQNNNTGVVCYDGGRCDGSGPRTIGAWGSRIRDYQPPQSLIEPGSNSGSSVAAAAPAPAPTPAPIFD